MNPNKTRFLINSRIKLGFGEKNIHTIRLHFYVWLVHEMLLYPKIAIGSAMTATKINNGSKSRKTIFSF